MWYEPVHEISNNVVCETSKASDQPAHTRRLIRAFAGRLNILWLLKKYALRILPFYVNFGILSFDRWNEMFPNRPVHVHIFLT